MAKIGCEMQCCTAAASQLLVEISVSFSHLFDHEKDSARQLQDHRRYLVELGVPAHVVWDFFSEATNASPNDDSTASTQLVETGRRPKDPKDGDPRTDQVAKGLPQNPGLASRGDLS